VYKLLGFTFSANAWVSGIETLGEKGKEYSKPYLGSKLLY
jgi:hypothetical protein